MIRTQIYLPEELHEALKEKAREEKTTMAQVIRKSLEKNIKQKKTNKTKAKQMKGAEFLLWLAKTAEKERWHGPKDLSINADRYLYGDKSPKWGYLYDKPKSKKTK